MKGKWKHNHHYHVNQVLSRHTRRLSGSQHCFPPDKVITRVTQLHRTSPLREPASPRHEVFQTLPQTLLCFISYFEKKTSFQVKAQ